MMNGSKVKELSIAGRKAIEELLDALGWPPDQALSRAIDRLIQLEEDPDERR